jgi:hypothetical protein
MAASGGQCIAGVRVWALVPVHGVGVGLTETA